MKKLIHIFILFFLVSLYKAQSNPFSFSCINESTIAHAPVDPHDDDDVGIRVPGFCNATSSYYNDANLYLPKTTDEIVYLKLNFIFLTKPDGTGNFEENNTEHLQVIDDIINKSNETLLNLGQPLLACEGYGNNNQTNTKFQLIVNKIWKIDSAWDYLVTGYDLSCGHPYANLEGSCGLALMPSAPNYHYSYLDIDPTVPSGINVVFANNGTLYNEIVNNQNYTAPGGQGWAIAQSPTTDFSQPLREFFPDIYNGYLRSKYYDTDNPNHPEHPNTPWSIVYSWFLYGLSGGLLHETGHCLSLGHKDNCFSAVMNPNFTSSRTYFSNEEISKMYLAASITNARKFFTENSFKNTDIDVSNYEIWDLNFRLYSNVKIDNNSSLKATCKIIMSPESKFTVKDGSNFIIEGANITSANNSTWNGIKVEGNGYLLINPNTLIDTNYFYAYVDNTPLSKGKISSSSDKTNNEIVENTIVDKDYRIYPNPAGDFINIETKNKIHKVEIYNLLNKSFSTIYKNNQVDVRSLPQGNYILKIHSDSVEKTIHFIKK